MCKHMHDLYLVLTYKEVSRGIWAMVGNVVYGITFFRRFLKSFNLVESDKHSLQEDSTEVYVQILSSIDLLLPTLKVL